MGYGDNINYILGIIQGGDPAATGTVRGSVPPVRQSWPGMSGKYIGPGKRFRIRLTWHSTGNVKSEA